MERSTSGKPYWQALANYPKHKEEIDALPRECDIIFALYPYENGKYLMEEDDFFMGIVVHCAEAKLATGGTFLERVRRAIEADLYKQKQEMRKLYNPYRNLYLDKCYDESKRPAVDWMDFSKYKE